MLASGIFPSNGLLIETKTGVILVDTPWDIPQTEQLLEWVNVNLNKKITDCFVTHWHDDRVTGIKILKERQNTRIHAYEKTAVKLSELGYDRPDIVLPSDTIQTIDGINIQTFYPGEGHTADNIVVWLPKEKILFGGCFVKSTESPGLGNIADANLGAWPSSVKKVQKKFKNPSLIVPGHQGWESVKSLDHTVRLLEAHKKNSR